MTQTEYTKAILKKIQKLNKKIDYKILQGQRYDNESLEHKRLLSKIQTQKNNSLFKKLFLTY